ncbi:hypothetical protein PILCRDRAFT_752168 [Piloderma croceum F 1598]|uniref:Uncharacterized protein n=1 Tax=Piloderma croceum (strain F 1598) TaxID=765440 RepID=A0A0C3B2U9_PILCF|nr:hypothetical protein PILCRDRAFT_752168 [Piloderma croceum F 1598]
MDSWSRKITYTMPAPKNSLLSKSATPRSMKLHLLSNFGNHNTSLEPSMASLILYDSIHGEKIHPVDVQSPGILVTSTNLDDWCGRVI